MKKKLLFINGHLNVGGVEKSLVDILRNLDPSKYEIDLLLLEGLGDYMSSLPKHVHILLCDLHTTYGPLLKCLFSCAKKRDWFSFRMRLVLLLCKIASPKYISLAEKELTNGKQYDCVIGFRSGICSEIAAYAVRAKKKLIWWHHGELNVNASAYEQVARCCDGVVAVSKPCLEMLENAMPSIRDKLTVIPNMLDEEDIRKQAEAFIPYPSEERTKIVTVGRLSPEKHMENVIVAAAILKEKGYDFHWSIVGDGVLRDAIEGEAKRNNVVEHVSFEGNKSNPYPYISHADLMVHPSYVESQGLSVLEAMTLGVPCVVTKSRGPCEFINDGENGLLTEQNAQSLAEQVERILSDCILYNKIKQNTVCPLQYRVESVIQMIERILG